MDSRFFLFQTTPKESFFSIRKVGIREPDKSLEFYSRILRLINWSPTGSFTGHLDFRLPQKYISHQNIFLWVHQWVSGSWLEKKEGTIKLKAPIYMRVTIAGERFELSTRRTVLPENWSAESGRVSGTNAKAKSVNTFLDSLQGPTVIKNKFLMKGKNWRWRNSRVAGTEFQQRKQKW